MKLGMVTYNLGRDWDLETLIARCEEAGFAGVELRTTHAHGVEVGLSAAERAEVKRRFADSAVELVGLGSAFEYDAVDPQVLRSHIDGTKEYVRLAHDLGVGGVKVRPNNVHVDKGIPIEQTLEQIGVSLRECGEFARDLGVQIRLEVHGRTTSNPANIRKIIDYADHDNVFVCWNSNATDLVDGSIDGSFASLQDAIALVHITELWSDYPWERLFTLLRQSGYAGYCLAEIPESPEPLRLMRYYRALWQALAKR